MKKENTIMIAAVCIVMIMVVGGYTFIKNSSGVNPPFTVIESESMQHSDKSEIGIIDTGDMIIVKSPTKTDIITYVEGYASGYESFGDYGSVIIYNRNVGNPVIHRAILWLNYEGNDGINSIWSAPALEKYSNLWKCSDSDNYNLLSGTLTIQLENDYRKINEITISLNDLIPSSGYITLGDNNSLSDQSSIISYNLLISSERIKSVAWKEIPWLGAIKMIYKGNLDVINSKVPNTIPNITAFIVTVIITIISIGFLIDEIHLLRIKKIRI